MGYFFVVGYVIGVVILRVVVERVWEISIDSWVFGRRWVCVDGGLLCVWSDVGWVVVYGIFVRNGGFEMSKGIGLFV